MDHVKYELAAHDDSAKWERLERARSIFSTICLLLVAGTISSVLGYFFYQLDTPGGTIVLMNLRIRFLPNRQLQWRSKKGQILLDGYLGTTFNAKVNHDVQNKNQSFMRINWSNQANLYVDWWMDERHIQCYKFSWGSPTCIHSILEDCFVLSGAHWYGGGSLKNQKWNIEELSVPLAPYLTGNIENYDYGKVLGRYWLSSKGIGIYVDPGSPLWVSINGSGDHKLCLRAAYDQSPYWQPKPTVPIHLNYTMCAGPNLTFIHRYMSQNVLPQKMTLPSNETLDYIINPPYLLSKSHFKPSTDRKWLQHEGLSILNNQQSMGTSAAMILNMANIERNSTDIIYDKNFNNSINWLQKEGFNVIFAVDPTAFINRKLKSYKNVFRAVFDNSHTNQDHHKVRWETTTVNLQEIMKEWFTKYISRLKSRLKITSFFFKGGDILSLPFNHVLIKGLQIPDTFTTLYQSMAIALDPGSIFESTTRGSNLSSFIMMRSRNWSWGGENGISTIIPEALTLGLMGCNFIMAPSLKPYPNLRNISDKNYPLKSDLEDIYLHWLQTVAFLPSLTLTTHHLHLGKYVVDITLEVLKLREKYSDLFLQVAKKASWEEPFLRPIWWIAPTDSQAQKINDQFLVGDNLMVAPITERNTWSRAIYLPNGQWLDISQNQTFNGPLWFRTYNATPSQIPLFLLENSS